MKTSIPITILLSLFFGINCDHDMKELSLQDVIENSVWIEEKNNPQTSIRFSEVIQVSFLENNNFGLTYSKLRTTSYEEVYDTLSVLVKYEVEDTNILFPMPIGEITAIEGIDTTLDAVYLSDWVVTDFSDRKITVVNKPLLEKKGLVIGFSNPLNLIPGSKE